MFTRTYDNTVSTPVAVHAWVRKGQTFKDEPRATFTVTSPKSGRVISDIRFDYLDKESIYQFQVSEDVDGRATAQKLLQAFEGVATSTSGPVPGHHFDILVATVEFTDHDFFCCVCADDGFRDRLQDYAD